MENAPVNFMVERGDLLRKLRVIAGGVSEFSGGKTKLYFPIRVKETVEKKMNELFGAPLKGPMGEVAWWNDKLKFHMFMVKGRNDFYVSIPSKGDEVKGEILNKR